MTTLFPTLLLTGLGLALAPVVLHLLNLQRQRPIPWAAMEFLLESQARNKAWINLKQWLLLAARVAAILLLALMVSRPQLTGGLASWLPGEAVHHVVVLDDSYSMSDRGAERTPWEKAVRAIDALTERAAESTSHRVTIIRTSAPKKPLRFEGDQLLTLRELVTGWRPSEMSGGLDAAISTAVAESGRSANGERVAAYVLSDFRRRDLLSDEAMSANLDRLADRAATLSLASCVDRRHGNLAIANLTLLPSPFVSGIEMTASLTVNNYGATDAGRTAIRLWRDEAPLPAIEFETIPAGESATRWFPVRYTDSGEHLLRAELPDDTVETDNVRRLALDLPVERQVLVVDGSGGHEGQAFATALRPRSDIITGWRPRVCGPGQVADMGDLSRFAVVVLLDVKQLDNQATTVILRYAQEGGGVMVVLGSQINRRFYNRQLLGGSAEPLLPILLDPPTQTALDANGRPASVRVVDHPALRVFAGDRASFLDLIRVRQRHVLRPSGDGEASSDRVRVLASLSTGAPLLLESIDGPGRVVCVLTATARPAKQFEGWSNLSVSPVFPILVNELTAYLAEPSVRPLQESVGASWRSVVAGALPDADRLMRLTEESEVVVATGNNIEDWGAVNEAGVYRLGTGQNTSRTVAINVDPDEGDLDFVDISGLRKLFQSVDLQVVAVEQLAGKATPAAVELYQRVALLLLLLLATEQAIAYWCSYHRSSTMTGGSAR